MAFPDGVADAIAPLVPTGPTGRANRRRWSRADISQHETASAYRHGRQWGQARRRMGLTGSRLREHGYRMAWRGRCNAAPFGDAPDLTRTCDAHLAYRLATPRPTSTSTPRRRPRLAEKMRACPRHLYWLQGFEAKAPMPPSAFLYSPASSEVLRLGGHIGQRPLCHSRPTSIQNQPCLRRFRPKQPRAVAFPLPRGLYEPPRHGP